MKEWLVDGLIPAKRSTLITGLPAEPLLVGLGCAVASDRRWLGRTVRRAPVIYVTADEARAKALVAAWLHRLDLPAAAVEGLAVTDTVPRVETAWDEAVLIDRPDVHPSMPVGAATVATVLAQADSKIGTVLPYGHKPAHVERVLYLTASGDDADEPLADMALRGYGIWTPLAYVSGATRTTEGK